MSEPEALARRPHHGGLPIPYVTALVDGRPDFRVHDAERRRRCAEERRCQLCGEELEGLGWFFGYEHALRSYRYAEPPAHEACARYALEVCPWLGGRGWRDQGHDPRVRTLAHPAKAPAAITLISARSWSLEPDYAAGTDVYIVHDVATSERIERAGAPA